MSTQITIERLGAQGDGIGHVNGKPVFVPFTLPGERANVAVDGKGKATMMALLQAADNRVDPACKHFTDCGGCSLQHLAMDDYLAFKRQILVDTLAREGVETDVGETVSCAPYSRRRVTFTARKTLSGIQLGYLRALSPEIIVIEECPIALPRIVEALPMFRELAELLAYTADSFHIGVTVTEAGFDIATTGQGKLTERGRKDISAFAMEHGIARVSADGEIVIEPKKPHVSFGKAVVVPPPGAFLQAVASAEEAMADLVLGHVQKSKSVADLFAGSGTFALRIANLARVHAVEGEEKAVAALDRAVRATQGIKPVTVEKRDLFRRPLTFKELNAFDAVVFDPPRAGAEDQCRQLARADVAKVAAVSCNPQTLGRDLKILIDGGYRLKIVTPIDQFLWSPHLEAVALLEKKVPRKR